MGGNISPSSLAAGTAQGAQNTTFKPETSTVPRKICVIGTSPAPGAMPQGWIEGIPKLILNPDEVGAAFGRGSCFHRLAIKAFKGSKNVPTWGIWLDETNLYAGGGAGAYATGTIAPTVGGSFKGGTVHMYIAGEYVPFVCAADDDAADIKQHIYDAINAAPDIPVISTLVGGVLTIKAKDKTTWGNGIVIAFNLGFAQEMPEGLTLLVTQLSSGGGVPWLDYALQGLGEGDLGNSNYFTELIHPCGQSELALDDLAAYVGNAQDKTGLWASLVARPMRSLVGDTAPGSDGLTGALALAESRRTDMASGVLVVPGSPDHPGELAALALGTMARIADLRCEQPYVDAVLEGAHGSWYDPNDDGQYTNEYANRDLCVKGGVGTTQVKNGVVTLQDVITFYRPDNVPVASNGWRSQRNIAILQNILDSLRQNFASEKWKGISIVSDVRRVVNPTSRAKARSIEAVKDDLLALINAFAGRAWIYETAFSVRELRKADAVVIRPSSLGFDYTLRLILSGEGNILNGTVEFDISIAVTLSA